jgi:hypothetical protein
MQVDVYDAASKHLLNQVYLAQIIDTALVYDDSTSRFTGVSLLGLERESMLTCFIRTVPLGGGNVSALIVDPAELASIANEKGGVFYIFQTQAEYNNWCAANLGAHGLQCANPALSAAVDGFSQFPKGAANGPASYTIIFATINGLPNKVIATTTAHEVGHYMDWLFGHAAGSTTTVSNSADWQSELTQDWKVLNTAGVLPCANPADNDPGVFSYFANEVIGGNKYICTGTTGQGTALSAGYAGTNEAVLQKAWPYFYQKGSDTNNVTYPWQELFSEEYGGGARVDGQSDFANDPSTADWYLGYGGIISQSGFACILNFINYLVQENQLPSKANPPGGWPANCPLF